MLNKEALSHLEGCLIRTAKRLFYMSSLKGCLAKKGIQGVGLLRLSGIFLIKFSSKLENHCKDRDGGNLKILLQS